MAIDRAAILIDVLRRNALRQHAWLPRLDIRAEFDRAVALAIDGEVRALAEQPEHRAMLDQIVEEVGTELFERHGITCDSWGGRYAIGHLTRQRQSAYLRAAYRGEARPAPPRHPVRYAGGGHKRLP